MSSSLKRINVIQSTESPSATDSADAFARLQDLMEAWQLERLTIPYIARTTWTISSTKGTLASPYTVGTGGDINVLRPPLIEDVRFQDTSVSPTLEYPLRILTNAQWEGIAQKNLTSTLPSAAYYKPTYASSLGSLYLWMVPSQANLQGVLYSPAGVAKPDALSSTIILPQGYFRFIRDNLAVELAPEWRDGLPIDPLLMKSASESKAQIKRANQTDYLMSTPLWGAGIYNVYSDTNY